MTLIESKSTNKIGFFVRNQSIVVPIAAIFVAFFLGGILIFLQGVNPLVAYKAIFSEAWFDSDGLLRTFQKTTPLVLAGLCERCDSAVTKKKLNQWYLKITDYADRLLDDMDQLEGAWPEKVLLMGS